MESLLQEFHETRKFFLENSVTSKVAAPRQHALSHYVQGIKAFGALNGLCSSITESKHIDAVKKPWRHSSRNAPIFQMMDRITRLEKLAGLKTYLTSLQLMWGTTSQFMQDWITKSDGQDDDEVELIGSDSDNSDTNLDNAGSSYVVTAEDNNAAADDISLKEAGITTITSSVKLSQTYGTCCSYISICLH
jgi:hypothetical protein